MWRLFASLLVTTSSLAAVPDCPGYAAAGYQAIRTTPDVLLGTVGTAGDTPATVHEFRCILRRSDARSIFVNLLQEATVPGQLYALSGLYLLDRPFFEQVVGPYLTNRMTIGIGGGISFQSSVAEFTRNSIVTGNFPTQIRGDVLEK